MSELFWNTYFLHLAACFLMIGPLWFVQLVHYPLLGFAKVDFKGVERKHVFYTSFIAFPVMAIEGITGLILAIQGELFPWMQINFILLLISFAITFWFCFFKHLELLKNYSEGTLRELKWANLVRSLFWTSRGVLLLALVYTYF